MGKDADNSTGATILWDDILGKSLKIRIGFYKHAEGKSWNMTLILDQWLDLMTFGEESVATLQEFSSLVFPGLDSALDVLYSRISQNAKARSLFSSPEAMARAKAMQKQHWQNYVLVGRFDDDYVKATRAIGQTHFRLKIDPKVYTGAYSILQTEVIKIITRELNGRPDDLCRYLDALNQAVFIDMGLSVSVYYDSLVAQVEEMAQELNLSLARAGEYRDNETGKHIMRMSHMCEILALKIGCDISWAKMLKLASPLHDVGKIGIPDNILLKPGRLDGDELEVMRTHSAIGGDIIPEFPADIISMARRIALTHHERWDGAGYPVGLKGEEIPLEGRIAAICDVYDALVSTRPYKRAWSKQEALEYLQQNRGGHFDPNLVDHFIASIEQIDDIQERFAEEASV